MAFTKYHPVFLDLNGRTIVVVGGGAVAVEKLHSLIPTGARIWVVSPKAVDEIKEWAHQGALTWVARAFVDRDIDAAFMAVAATDDPPLNSRVFQLADEQNRLANSVDDPVNCNFIMSAITRQGPMQVAVSSAGCSPALAKRLRDRITEELLTEEVGELAEFLGSQRTAVKDALPSYKERKQFWEAVLDSDIPALLKEQGEDAALERFQALLSGQLGHVVLVGAGPGDPDLITLKGLKALEAADVVLYDRLANPALLKHAPEHAVLIDVGKAPGDRSQPRQETINALMIEHARRGRNVVRLKGGDPFVFGRGGEELLALRDHGIECEVVPGISSAIAAPASAGIPVTHRGLSTGFAVFTAQGARTEGDTVPWDVAAKVPTLVLLMGVDRLGHIARKLVAHGLSTETPVAVISNATCESQQIAIGTLATIERKAAHLPSPATIVVGEVVRLAQVGELAALASAAA